MFGARGCASLLTGFFLLTGVLRILLRGMLLQGILSRMYVYVCVCERECTSGSRDRTTFAPAPPNRSRRRSIQTPRASSAWKLPEWVPMRAELMGHHPQAHAISTTRRDAAGRVWLNGAAPYFEPSGKGPEGKQLVMIKSFNPGILVYLDLGSTYTVGCRYLYTCSFLFYLIFLFGIYK